MARPRTRSIAVALIAAAPIVLATAVLGWGYWHVSSHAALHVAVYDVALKNERQAYGQVRVADLVFKDAAGAVLAKGRIEASTGVFSIDHPGVGDCRREERAANQTPEGMKAWQRCFETQSQWLTTWVPRMHTADVVHGKCRIAAAPVLLERARDDWWLWWIPSPHIGGPPYTGFQASFWIDSANCRPHRNS